MPRKNTEKHGKIFNRLNCARVQYIQSIYHNTPRNKPTAITAPPTELMKLTISRKSFARKTFA
ncbi:MAG: hypothetical protein DRR16_22755 [Candidatus Parabeggiatoa sp. nov. 3]|nr:MAG: hypothetical protein DRR16_22755 [Gammaproteobacteria bacterium]